MKLHLTKDVRVILPQAALTVIFDECDHFERDETGGRVIGTFKENDGMLTLYVTGIIESSMARWRLLRVPQLWSAPASCRRWHSY